MDIKTAIKLLRIGGELAGASLLVPEEKLADMLACIANDLRELVKEDRPFLLNEEDI